jgi:hypothetical protein
MSRLDEYNAFLECLNVAFERRLLLVSQKGGGGGGRPKLPSTLEPLRHFIESQRRLLTPSYDDDVIELEERATELVQLQQGDVERDSTEEKLRELRTLTQSLREVTEERLSTAQALEAFLNFLQQRNVSNEGILQEVENTRNTLLQVKIIINFNCAL